MKEKEFLKNLLALAELFDKELTANVQQIYLEVFKNEKDENLLYAFEQIILRCKFFPRPAEIFDFINEKNEISGILNVGMYRHITDEKKMIDHQITENRGGDPELIKEPLQRLQEKWRKEKEAEEEARIIRMEEGKKRLAKQATLLKKRQ